MGKASRRKRERRAEIDELLSKTSDAIDARPRIAREGAPKISGALSTLVRPYADDDIDIEEYRSLVTMGAIAWNLAVQPEVNSSECMQQRMEDAEVASGGAFRDFIEELRIRKGLLFPNDRRLIVHTEVRERKDGSFYLVAAGAKNGADSAASGA